MNSLKLKSENIYAGYTDKNVLQGVSLHIPQNKISVILGSNGSGKSTMLKTFCRLLSPTDGQITLNGQSLSTLPTKSIARNIGLLPQNSIAPDGIKVVDLVSRGRFPYRKFMAPLSEEDHIAISEALEFMGITELADCNVNELSGGQRQRVFIALALAQQTDILFLDEPTTFLDISYQIEILDLLRNLNKKRNTTIVMVLHDINLSSRYADYLFAMKSGRLLFQGTPEEIITSEKIKEIYGLDSIIINDPVSNSPLMIPS